MRETPLRIQHNSKWDAGFYGAKYDAKSTRHADECGDKLVSLREKLGVMPLVNCQISRSAIE